MNDAVIPRLIKFPSIGKYRNVVRKVRKWAQYVAEMLGYWRKTCEKEQK